MSMRGYSQPSSGNVSTNTVIICFTSIVIVGMAAIVAVVFGSKDESTDVILARAGLITGFISLIIPTLILLVRQDRTTQVIESLKDDTNSLLNGEGRTQIERGSDSAMEARGVGENPPAA